MAHKNGILQRLGQKQIDLRHHRLLLGQTLGNLVSRRLSIQHYRLDIGPMAVDYPVFGGVALRVVGSDVGSGETQSFGSSGVVVFGSGTFGCGFGHDVDGAVD